MFEEQEKEMSKPLKTIWGEQLDPRHVLEEYPRPQLVRGNWMNLNGYWDYAFTKDTVVPRKWDGRILVPFSPEALLSGVERQLQPDEYLHYRRTVRIRGTSSKATVSPAQVSQPATSRCGP